MTISASGSFSVGAAFGLTTLTVASAVVGDVRFFGSFLHGYVSNPITAVAGGGVGTWNHVISMGAANGNSGEIWWGPVTSTTTPTTITVTWTNTPGGNATDFASQMFSTSSGGTWYIQTSATTTVASGATTCTWPSLTPVGTQGYFGTCLPANTAVAGSTTGFMYQLTSDPGIAIYNTGVSAASAPTCTEASGYYDTLGVLFGATVGGQPFFEFI